MLTRRKRPINLSKQAKYPSVPIPQFKPKQSLAPIDLLADFQFTTKSNIKLKEIQLTVFFNDLYPYFTVYSITTCYVLLILASFIWSEFHSQEFRIKRFFNPENEDIASFWTRLIELIVQVNFVLIFGAYLQSVYKLWYFIALGLVHFVSFVVFETKGGIGFGSEGHIYRAVYSIYWLVLVQRRMQSVNLAQMWMRVKAMPVWQRLYSLGKQKKSQQPTDMIDFGFTERPLSIKGGEAEDSFTYDSFFSYSDTFDLTDQRHPSHKGYFQSNISKRSSHISNHPGPKRPVPSYYSKFTSDKHLTQQSEIQSTIASSQVMKKQKQEQEAQLIKVYKCFILSFLVYSTVSRVEWTAYLVAGCVILGCVEIFTNQKLKFIKFGCFIFVAIFVVAWM